MQPWPADGTHRIPFGVYTDAAVHLSLIHI